MSRTFLTPSLIALITTSIVACGTDDPKSGSTKATSAPTAAAHATKSSTAAAEKPAPKPAASPAVSEVTKPAAAPPVSEVTKPAAPAASEVTKPAADVHAANAPAGAAQESESKPAAGTASGTTDAAAPSAAGDPVQKLRDFIATLNIDKQAKDWKQKLSKPPQQTFDPAKKYFWLLNTTEGAIKIRLMPDIAPMHVSSTIYLTELGFYDDIKFHRVIPDFMAQGGDPTGTGGGSPGYKYAGEFSPNVKHSKPGLLSMANAGPNTDGSQFFLTFVPTPHLDGKHTLFGEIVEGLDNLKKIEQFGSPSGAPGRLVKIETAKILVE